VKREEVLIRLALALANAVKHVEAIQLAVLLRLRETAIVAHLSYLVTLLSVIQLAIETLLDEIGGEE